MSTPDPVGAASGPVSQRLRLGGARVDVMTSATLMATVQRAVRRPHGPPLLLASANVDHLTHFGRGSGREHVFDAHAGAEWLVLLDGMPLVWWARRLTGAEAPLLAGSDLLPQLLQVLAHDRVRIAVVGGRPQMHRAFEQRLRVEHPQLEFCLAVAPSRAELGDRACRDALASQVEQSAADVLLVALGKPVQEDFLLEQSVASGVKVAAAFGAACDFYAGTEQRVPAAWRGSGFEWLYRLQREPRRLGHRYLVEGPVAARRLLRDSGQWERPATAPRSAPPAPGR